MEEFRRPIMEGLETLSVEELMKVKGGIDREDKIEIYCQGTPAITCSGSPAIGSTSTTKDKK